MHFILPLVLASCTFQVFEVDEWNCIQGGMYPEYQIPRLCNSKNQYLPTRFKVVNNSLENDGEVKWSLSLQPAMSFKISNERKEPMYKFLLENFECESFTSYKATVLVHPVMERTPADAKFELIVGLIALILLIFCCCVSTAEQNTNAFTTGLVYNSFRERERAHFE
jgi:hypothetical protein